VRIPITLSLILALSCQAQQVSGPKSDLVQSSSGLKIVVLQGDGAQNNVRTRSATQPAVEVRDDGDKPVPGAEVVFQLPPAGPGGVFNGWMRTQTARTSPEGRAQANGFAPNEEEGKFNIRVTATSGNKTSNALIAQTNTRGTGNGAPQAKSNKKMWTIIAIVGAAALTGGIIAATRGGSSSTAETVAIPVTISPGPVTVGGPR
jgi:hypothetical protein